MRIAQIGLLATLAACAATHEEPSQGAVQQLVTTTSAEAGVPADLVMAIAIEEGGVMLPASRAVAEDESVPAAGLLELRRGKLDTLSLGASLLGSDELALRADTALGTRAGTKVLAYLGAQNGVTADLASWRPALQVLAGMDDDNSHNYASRVLGMLRTGGEWTARDGERVHIIAHPEIPYAETVETKSPVANATAEFPGAIWFTTSCTNKCTVGRPLGTASVNKIVIHDTEGGWNASVATLQNDSGKSVHYIVDADGSRVGQFRSENDTTYHAGNYYYNETSIGIEHVGFASQTYSKALYAKSAALVKNIRTRWNVPLDRAHIVGHYQIPDGTKISESSAACGTGLDACETSANYGGASNHRDPGYNWQWCQYMESLGGKCACHDAWADFNCTTDHTEAWRCHNDVLEEQKCTGPAGCKVMPIGTPDVCDTSASGDSGSGSDAGSGSDTGSGGDPMDPGADPTMPPADDASSAGCSAGGGGAGSLALFALVMVVTRRRRR